MPRAARARVVSPPRGGYTRESMGKSADKGDSTLLVSESQILTVTPQPPSAMAGKNDQSVWKGVVVSADDFAPAPAPRKARAPRWLIVGVLGAIAIAVGVIVAFYTASPSTTSAAVGATPGSSVAPVVVPAADAAAAIATPHRPAPVDAAPADAPPADAPPDAAPAAVPEAVVPPKPATSKPVTKKPAIKKKVVLKKKPATTTKRRAR